MKQNNADQSDARTDNMSSRQAVLNRIARALQRPADGQSSTLADRPADVNKKLLSRQSHTQPKVQGETVDALIANMESVQMSVVRLQTGKDCKEAVKWYLQSEGIDVSDGQSVTVAPALSALEWPDEYSNGAATGQEKVSITSCVAAVAETGSIVTISGADTPATLNFLPETHIVVAHESSIVKHVDDVFPILRQQSILPRAVNFITGPSRTADIEQTLEIGAHGPKRMHVLLVAGDIDGITGQ